MAESDDVLKKIQQLIDSDAYDSKIAAIHAEFEIRKQKLDDLAKFKLTYAEMSEEEKKSLQELVDIANKRLDKEEKQKIAEESTISSMQKQLELEKKKAQQRKLELEDRLKITTSAKEATVILDKIATENETITALSERQAKLDEGKEIQANKLLNIQKAYKDIVSNIGKKQKEQLEQAKDAYEFAKKQRDLGLATDEEVEAKRKDVQVAANKAELAEQLGSIVTNVGNKLASTFSSFLSKIDSAINLYSDNVGKVNARLQAMSDKQSKTLDSIYGSFVSSMGGTNAYISYAKLLESVDVLSASGISYNIEERAFFQTISDKMVASFNVLDATLLRMTRLQQADMTKLMLGNEALLTRLFNQFFEDSSYLATNVSDNISSSIFDAASTMNQASAAAFEFTVQKWLGALYEVGVSQETVSSIATAINALGSGNAQGFMSTPVATLLNMSIARSDYSLADVLTQGLNTEFIDSMMSSMITLLKDIKNNTTNQVTLQAYSNVLGMSMSDIRGFNNLTDLDIASLAGTSKDANDALAEVDYQIDKYTNERITIQTKINNLLDNVMVTAGVGMADSVALYSLYKAGTLLSNMASGTLVGLIGTAAQLGGVAGGFANALTMGSDYSNQSYSSSDESEKASRQNLVSFYNQLKSLFVKNSQIPDLLKAPSSNAYVRHSRGSDFIGVSPEYGIYYTGESTPVTTGTVSTSTSSSAGISIPTTNVSSSENAYATFTPVESNNYTTEEKIMHLDSKDEAVEYLSQESAEAIDWEITDADFYRELFREQNFPIKVHFDEDTQSFLNEWSSVTSKIFDRQHDAHVTNTVDVTGSVNVSGSVSLDGVGGGYVNSVANGIYRARQ